MAKPKLRFSEFTDEWEEKKLKEIADRITRKNKDNESDLPLTISSIDGLVDQQTYFNKVVASKDMSGYYLLKNGEFAYNKSYSVGYDYGSIKRLDKYDMGALSTLYICFALKDGTISDFLIKYFDSQKWYKEIYMISAEGARNHGLLNVPTEDFFKIKLHLPKDLKEQQKIADFLSKIDEKIVNQEAVVSDYEEMKKGLMQKIFSQEVRFKADDGSEYPEWEEKTFMEVFNVVQNNTFSRNCLNKDEGEVLNIHYGDVLIKYGSITDICKEEIPFINTDILLDKFTKESYLCNGDIVIADTAEDMTVGKATEICGAAEKKVLSGLHTIPCRPKMIFAPRYLGYYINSEEYHNQLMPLIQGIKVSSISKGNISKTIITYPCLEEQQKIADCLSAMDKKIETEKKILGDWKELKKALLQQMFV